MATYCLAVAPPKDQRAIAAFLDRETAKIDALVAKKERLIELLQEKRTALITRAVTRGLEPNASMKDSGVEWLGEIPAHWEVKNLKRISRRVDVGIAEAATHAYADEGVPIIRTTNVRANRLLTDDLLRIERWFADKNRSKYLLAGDLVTVRTGVPGTTAVIPCLRVLLLLPELHRRQGLLRP
jgi:type I restriction enzyme S subunit